MILTSKKQFFKILEVFKKLHYCILIELCLLSELQLWELLFITLNELYVIKLYNNNSEDSYFIYLPINFVENGKGGEYISHLFTFCCQFFCIRKFQIKYQSFSHLFRLLCLQR